MNKKGPNNTWREREGGYDEHLLISYNIYLSLFELQFVANAQTPYATLLGNSFEGEQL